MFIVCKYYVTISHRFGIMKRCCVFLSFVLIFFVFLQRKNEYDKKRIDMSENIIDWTTEYPVISWRGYDWSMDAEGGRKIHPDSPYEYYHTDCVSRDGENIILTVMERPQKVGHWNGVVYDSRYARGMIRSVNPFTYGTFVLECVLPGGGNLHSSFWLTNEKIWPPEIDIFEAYTNRSGCYMRWPAELRKRTLLPVYAIESNMHYSDSGGNHANTGADGCVVNKLRRPAKKVNEYRMEWTKDRITVIYGGNVVRELREDDFPEIFADLNRHPHMFLMINTGLRGDWFRGMKSGMVVRDFRYYPE